MRGGSALLVPAARLRAGEHDGCGRSLPLPPGASTEAFPRLQCLVGPSGLCRPGGLSPRTQTHRRSPFSHRSPPFPFLFLLLSLGFAQFVPPTAAATRSRPQRAARRPPGWMAALRLTSQADSQGARRRRAQTAGAGANTAAVRAGLPPPPLELPPPPLLLLPSPSPPLPQLHAPGPPGGRASLPQAPPSPPR